VARASRGKQQIENKLNQILFNEVLYDGLPLSEVVRDLSDQARRRDPAKQGLNFVITSVPAVPAPSNSIDPTTGLPVPAVPVDVNNAIVRLHLRDVRLKDVLDAITRISDQPIKYSVEEYGVVFSPAAFNQNASFGFPPISPPTEPVRLQVRTFKVDTNTFAAGLRNAFGIEVGDSDARSQQALDGTLFRLAQEEGDLKAVLQRREAGAATEDEVKSAEKALATMKAQKDEALAKRSGPQTTHSVPQALRELLQILGISLDTPGKAVFYNDLTGVVMVRATAEDLELVQAAIETLGGRQLRAGTSPQFSEETSVGGRVGADWAAPATRGKKTVHSSE
jgi:hypothetical protein